MKNFIAAVFLGVFLVGCGSDGDGKSDGTNKTINPVMTTGESGQSADATAPGEVTDCDADKAEWHPAVMDDEQEMDCTVEK